MKKVIGTIGGVLAVGVLAGPFITAGVAKQSIENDIAMINEIPGYKAELVEYEKGWLSSSAVLTLGIDTEMMFGPAMADLPASEREIFKSMPNIARFELSMGHGPVIFADGGKLGLASINGTLDLSHSDKAVELQKKLGIDSFMTYSSLINYFGNASFTANSPKFTFNPDEDTTITFGGIDLNGGYERSNRKGDVSGQIGEILVEASEGTLRVEPMILSSNMEYISPMIQLGSGDFKVPSVTFYKSDAGGEPLFSMKDLGVNYSMDKDSEKTVKMNLEYSVNQVRVEGEQVDNARLGMAFERMSIDGLEKYYDSFADLMKKRPDYSQQQAEMAMIGQEMANDFLPLSPVIAITDLSFEYAGEKLSSNARVEFDGSNMTPPIDLNNPMMMLVNLVVDAEANISEGLALKIASRAMAEQMAGNPQVEGMSPDDIQQMAEAQAGMMLQMGFLEKTENGYRAVFSMKEGAMTLNGEQLPMM
ncbi:YdgA family protein [Porticoccaceae bacterium LTM1]|nr:YdgA family protein [Porticoccaceae bacterium LTM1]